MTPDSLCECMRRRHWRRTCWQRRPRWPPASAFAPAPAPRRCSTLAARATWRRLRARSASSSSKMRARPRVSVPVEPLAYFGFCRAPLLLVEHPLSLKLVQDARKAKDASFLSVFWFLLGVSTRRLSCWAPAQPQAHTRRGESRVCVSIRKHACIDFGVSGALSGAVLLLLEHLLSINLIETRKAKLLFSCRSLSSSSDAYTASFLPGRSLAA